MTRQFVLFLIASGTAAAVNFGSRIAFSHWLPYTRAILLAYCLGMMTAFFLNRLLVFRGAANSIHHQVGWFVAVNIAAVLQTLIVSIALAKWILPALELGGATAETIAHAIGVAVPAITSYFGHKHLSFSSPRA
ncbi:GtrA family protein [Pseudoxanthomonas sp. J35]|uniref:GtrA family protein n=1 Tax=Pseudoxanthomonas sp. J35 TaxID=935852 RepID=UPI00048E13D5|nr:GtrA family protein [Pseudoxanthomonas sp. J35]